MEIEIRKYLQDISDSIANIDTHLFGNNDFVSFSSSITIRRAIERKLEIIGEAMSKILILQPAFPVTHARKIVDLRNRVIHAYDSIDINILWRIVVKDIPILKSEIEILLKK